MTANKGHYKAGILSLEAGCGSEEIISRLGTYLYWWKGPLFI